MKAIQNRIWSALRIALGLAVMVLVLSATGGWSGIKTVVLTPWLLPVLAGLAFLGAAVEAGRLQLLMRAQGAALTGANAFRLVLIGNFFNFAIPGGTGGDLVKLYYLAAENRGRGVEVATVVLVDRAIGLLALLVLIVGFSLAELPVVLGHTSIKVLVAAAALALVAMILLGIASGSDSIRRWPAYRYLMGHLPLRTQLARVADALYQLHDRLGLVLLAVLVSIAGQLVLGLAFVVTAAALLSPPPVLVTGLLGFVGMLANAIPVTPGGLGVGEAAFEGLFGLIGVSGGAGLMVAWRLGLIPVAVIGGVLYLFGIRKSGAGPAISATGAA